MKSKSIFLSVLLSLAFLCVLQLPAWAKKDSEKPTIVLVHGAHLSGLAWKDVAKQFKQWGYKVQTPDMPGRPIFRTVTLEEMATSLCESIKTNSVLVGHSQGGAIINEAVGKCPEKIKGLVYVSAVVPLNGETSFEALAKDSNHEYLKAIVPLQDRAAIKDKKTFLQVMEPGLDLGKFAWLRLYSEPIALAASKLSFNQETYNKIPKAYILTEKDPVFTLANQKKYLNRMSFGQVYALENSGHLPMLSYPKELSELIASFLLSLG